MTDIVDRLRMVPGFVRFETGDRIAAAACLSEEAADVIEHLREVVKQLRDDLTEQADR